MKQPFYTHHCTDLAQLVWLIAGKEEWRREGQAASPAQPLPTVVTVVGSWPADGKPLSALAVVAVGLS